MSLHDLIFSSGTTEPDTTEEWNQLSITAQL